MSTKDSNPFSTGGYALPGEADVIMTHREPVLPPLAVKALSADDRALHRANTGQGPVLRLSVTFSHETFDRFVREAQRLSEES